MQGDTQPLGSGETGSRESPDMKGDIHSPESGETSTGESQIMKYITRAPGSSETSTKAGNSLHPAQQTATVTQQHVNVNGQKQATVSSSLTSHQGTLKQAPWNAAPWYQAQLNQKSPVNINVNTSVVPKEDFKQGDTAQVLASQESTNQVAFNQRTWSKVSANNDSLRQTHMGPPNSNQGTPIPETLSTDPANQIPSKHVSVSQITLGQDNSSELALQDCKQEDLAIPSVPRKDPISRQSSSSEQTPMAGTPGATGQRKSLDCFNFTGRQPPQAVVTNIGSRDPMVKKMVYNQYRDMLRKYSNTSNSP